jgi:hypothetical protein
MEGGKQEQREESKPPAGAASGVTPDIETSDSAGGAGERVAAGDANAEDELCSEGSEGVLPHTAETVEEIPVKERPALAGPKPEPPKDDTGKAAEGMARDRAESYIRDNHGQAFVAVNMEFHEARNAATATAKKLSLGHFEIWPADRVKRDVAKLITDDEQIKHLVSVLKERRIIVLVGEPELGKATAALLMAHQLCVRGGISGVLLCRGLDGTVRVNFNELAGGEPAYQNQLLIFKDAFAWDNADLHRLGTELTTTTAQSHAENLKRAGSYLMFTSDPSKVKGSESLHNLGILQQMSRPTPDRLAESFQNEADHLMGVLVEKAIPVDKVKEVVDSEGKVLAEKLGTFPRIARFVRDYLRGIAEGRLTPSQALERMDDLRPWLLSDLTEDFDAFCFVLALVLCSAMPRFQGVRWLGFEEVRGKVGVALRRELRRMSRDRAVSDICLYEAVVKKARAEIVRSPSREDIIRFADERYPARLWQVLLGPGRNLLALLRPLLHDMLHEQDPFLQEVAAQALGRIGQLDPAFVTNPMLEDWVYGEQSDQSDLLGQLLQGVMSSGDRSYRNDCLARLRWIAVGGNMTAARAAVVSLKGVGSVDLPTALAGLRHVLEDRVEIAWDFLRHAERMLREYEGRVRHEELRDAGWAVLSTGFASEEGAFIFGAVQYTIAGLMFSFLDLTSVLAGLAKWMAEDDETLAPLVIYLFLHERGLANLMQRYKLTIDRDWQDLPTRCDRIVYALGTGGEAIERVQIFLRRVFRNLSRFPGLYREILREELFTKLKDWAREACKVPEIRGAVVELLARLYNSREAEFSDAIDRWLRGDHDFANRQSELHKIAVDVLTWTGPSSGEASLLPAGARRG